MNEPLHIYIETYGCQMNDNDSRIIRSILSENSSVQFTEDIRKARWILLNTCAVRENAEQRILSRIRFFRQRAKGSLNIAILGCMAQNQREKLYAVDGSIRLVAGPDSYRGLAGFLEQIDRYQAGPEDSSLYDEMLSLRSEELYDDIMPSTDPGRATASVTIMRGCNQFCSFCVVPYTRGRERSRSIASILKETHYLVRQGIREITFLGQNVNSYRYKEGVRTYCFTDLMRILDRESGLSRIRFMSPHPKDFPMELLECIAGSKTICPHIHLPLQSGSDRVLKLMKRNTSRKAFEGLVDTIRRVIPQAHISTDVIFGFPSETDDDARETLSVMEYCRFSSAFIFKYSERSGTYAARCYNDDVPDEVKSARVVEAVNRQQRISREINRSFIGQTVEVLIEGRSKRSPLDAMGRMPTNQVVVLPRFRADPGSIVKAQILSANSATLFAMTPKREE